MNNGVITVRRVVRVAVAVLVAGMGMGGCANQQALDEARDSNRSLQNSNNELQAVNAQLRNENELLQKSRIANEATLAQYKQINDDLAKKLGATGQDLEEMNRRLAGLALDPIDPETNRQLAALAAQYPDMIKYDEKHGMLRFASDLTFDSGQDKLKENAANSLAALAKILNSGAAAAYEVMIVGHTDAQPVSSATIQRGHASNMHLSCHRAISVRNALSQQGVPKNKMFAAGWGEERPLVPSGPKGNTPANRRVEIFLTRPTGTPVPLNAPAAAKEATPSKQPDMTK